MKKGQGLAGSWIMALLILFILVVLWNIFSVPVGEVLNVTGGLIADLNDSAATSVHNTIKTAWNSWVLVMVFGVIIFVIARAIFGEQYS